MTDTNTIYATAELNDVKVKEFVESAVSDYKEGKITEEEINKKFNENLASFFNATIKK